MKKLKKLIFYWLPPILWMLFIFFLSSKQSISITKEFVWDFIIFKTFHLIEYAALNFLFFRAFYGWGNKKGDITKILILSLFFSIVYAATDEYHQTYTATREGRFRDVIIDSAGAVLMYIYIRKTLRYWKSIL